MKRISLYIAAFLSFTAVFGCGIVLPAHSVKASADVPSAEPGEESTLLPELEVDPSGVDHEGGGAGFNGQDTLMPEVDTPEDSSGGDTIMPEVNPSDDSGNGDTLMPEVNPPDDSGNGDTVMPEVNPPDDSGSTPGGSGSSTPDSTSGGNGTSGGSGSSSPGSDSGDNGAFEISDSSSSGSSGESGSKTGKGSGKTGNSDNSGSSGSTNNGSSGSGSSGSSNNGSSGSSSSGSADNGSSGSSSSSSSSSSNTSTKDAVETKMPFTVTGKLAVDQNAVLRVLKQYGYSQEELSSWTTLLNQLSVSKDILVMAGGGAQYELTGTDGTKISLVEEADSEGSGSLISGSMFSGYLLTRSGGQNLLKELAVSKDVDPKDVNTAVQKAIQTIGEVSESDGSEAKKVLSACTALMHALPEALLLYSTGFDALEEQLGLCISEDKLKSVKAFSLTEDTEGTSYVLGLTPKDEGVSAIRMTLRLNGDEVDLTIENASASLSYHHYTDGAEIRLKSTGTRIPFRLSASVLIDDEITGCTRLYLADSEDPAAVKFSTLKAGGERTLSIEKDGKERLSLEEIADDILGAADKLQKMTSEERQAFTAFFSI